MLSSTEIANSTSSQAVIAEDVHIVKSPLPEIQPVIGLTVPEYLRKVSQKYQAGNAVAIECLESGIKYTQKDVFDMGQRFAAGLIKLGIQRKTIIAVALPNIPEFPSIMLGLWDAGAICSAVNPAYGLESMACSCFHHTLAAANALVTPDEMKAQLEDCEASYVVTLPSLVSIFQEIQKETLPSLKIIVVGETGETQIEGCASFWELVKTETEGVGFLRGAEIDTTEEVAMLPYSSGTTGLPKGIIISHSNLCTGMFQLTLEGVLIMEERGLEPGATNGERLLAVLPFFHVFGMVICLLGFRYGVHSVVISKFDPLKFLNAIRTHRPTILHLVPPLMTFLGNHPMVTKDDFKSVKTIVSGAAPIGQTLMSCLLQKAEKTILFQDAYGMTEMSGCTHILNPEIPVCKTKSGSVGHLVPSVMAKVSELDGSERSLGPNEIGELWIKGPQMMKGYLKNEEATRNTIDSEGWLHTGDIVYYDTDSCFYIVDRLKELIKVKGEQVAPAELENTLRQHPLILDAAVIGVPDDYAGELPRAYVISKSANLKQEEVQDFVKSKLAYFKQLKGGVEFVDTIPKTPSGKILRRLLQQKFAETKNKLATTVKH